MLENKIGTQWLLELCLAAGCWTRFLAILDNQFSSTQTYFSSSISPSNISTCSSSFSTLTDFSSSSSHFRRIYWMVSLALGDSMHIVTRLKRALPTLSSSVNSSFSTTFPTVSFSGNFASSSSHQPLIDASSSIWWEELFRWNAQLTTPSPAALDQIFPPSSDSFSSSSLSACQGHESMDWTFLATLLAEALGPLAALRVLSRVTGDATIDLSPFESLDSSATPAPALPPPLPPIQIPPSAIPIEFFLCLLTTQSSSQLSSKDDVYDSLLEKYDAYLWTPRPRQLLPDCAASLTSSRVHSDESVDIGGSPDEALDAAVLPPMLVSAEDAVTHWGIRLPALSLAESLCLLCRAKLSDFVTSTDGRTDKRVVVCGCGCAFHRPCLREAAAAATEDDDDFACPLC